MVCCLAFPSLPFPSLALPCLALPRLASPCLALAGNPCVSAAEAACRGCEHVKIEPNTKGMIRKSTNRDSSQKYHSNIKPVQQKKQERTIMYYFHGPPRGAIEKTAKNINQILRRFSKSKGNAKKSKTIIQNISTVQ